MTRISGVVVFGSLLCLVGCGPMNLPMVPRLDKEGQSTIDESWEKALKPIDRLDHQVLLDTLVGTSAYQLGVDKLYFRSEKRFSGGLVIMEVHYDRATPAEDRFEVKVEDLQGEVLRRERYSRDDVEKTYNELFTKPHELAPGEKETAAQGELRARYEARWARIGECFPKLKEEANK